MKSNITYGEKYGPAMEITDSSEAQAYFKQCVEHSVSQGYQQKEAENLERRNLGYYAGYYDEETMARVFNLYNCEHPFFGRKIPSAEEALEMGKKLGRGQLS